MSNSGSILLRGCSKTNFNQTCMIYLFIAHCSKPKGPITRSYSKLIKLSVFLSLGTCLEQHLCITAGSCCQCVYGCSLLSGVIVYDLSVILQC